MILQTLLAATLIAQPCPAAPQCSSALFDNVRRRLQSVKLGDHFTVVNQKWNDGVGALDYIPKEQFFAQMYVISESDSSCLAGALIEVHFDHAWRACEITEPSFTGIRYITRQQFDALTIGLSRCAVAEALGLPPRIANQTPLEYTLIEGSTHFFVTLTFSADGFLEKKEAYTR